jgi:hypothetical protein
LRDRDRTETEGTRQQQDAGRVLHRIHHGRWPQDARPPTTRRRKDSEPRPPPRRRRVRDATG